jgi:L-rhamnose-H+ transport protein
MEHSLLVGIALTMVAGLMSGNCMLPFKFLQTWKWENAWLVFSIVSLVIMPWALALTLVHHLFRIYQALTFEQLAIPVLLGAGWGIAQILFGISVKRLGMGIAYAIIVGLGAVLGTLVPLFFQHKVPINGHSTALILTGVAVMVAGIILTALGGHIRERDVSATTQIISQQKYITAVSLAVLCGFMAPMLNYSFAFGQDIALQSMHFGNSAVHAAYAVWPVGLLGGFIPNFFYSLYLLSKHRTYSEFRSPSRDFYWSSLMGVLWMGAFALYGMSAAVLGPLGTSIGWCLFQIFMIMVATLSGVLTGEWKRSPLNGVLLPSIGLLFLMTAIGLLALGNR